MTRRRRIGPDTWVLLACVIGLGGGGAAWILGRRALADGLWAGSAALVLVPITAAVIRRLLQRAAGVDVIAILAIVGAFLLGEYLAAAVIALMLATGRALEAYAASRAERELSSLLRRAPQVAHRLRHGGVDTIPVEDVRVGDTLIVKGGDILPVDGVVSAGPALLDEAALTGEARVGERQVGDPVRSGTANAGAAFQMRATTGAADSTYAGIIRMVREAQASKVPLVRLAERAAWLFVPVTLFLGRPGSRPRRARGRDPVSAPPRRSGRHRLGGLQGRSARDRREGGRGAREAGTRPGALPRQDRHHHPGRAAAAADRYDHA
jgi:cation transport ATPase